MGRTKQKPSASLGVSEPQVTGSDMSSNDSEVAKDKRKINQTISSQQQIVDGLLSELTTSQAHQSVSKIDPAANVGDTVSTQSKQDQSITNSIATKSDSNAQRDQASKSPMDTLDAEQSAISERSPSLTSSLLLTLVDDGDLSLHDDEQLEDFYCFGCEAEFNSITPKAFKFHQISCKKFQKMHPISLTSRISSPQAIADAQSAPAGSPPAPLSPEEMIRGVSAPAELEPKEDGDSESSLSEPPVESDTESEDGFGGDLENMPFAFIRGQFTSFPQSRDETPSNDASESEVARKSLNFPKVTPLDVFAAAADAADDLSYEAHYQILENLSAAANLLQEEYMLNQLQEKRLEREYPPSKEKNVVAKPYKNPRAALRPEAEDNSQKALERIFQVKQRPQDMIEAQAYGYDYDSNILRVGRQDPINQKMAGANGDGRRTLRQHQPTQKVIDGDVSTDDDSDATGHGGRPRRRVRDQSNVASRMNSEAPDDPKIARFQSGKRKGRPPGRDRIAQLQMQEGLRIRDSESPDRLPGRNLGGGRGVLESTERDEDISSEDGSGVEDEQLARGRRGTSEFEGKKVPKKSKQKKKSKPINPKRLECKRIQGVPVEERTPDEVRLLKNFREKKGAWATRFGKDPDKVLAQFDLDAMATDDEDAQDEENGAQESADDASQTQKSKKPRKPSAPAVAKDPSLPPPEKQKKPKAAKGETAASRNMIERWRKKKEAEARGDASVSNIGRYAKKKDGKEVTPVPKSRRPRGVQMGIAVQPQPQQQMQPPQEAVSGIITFKLGGYGKKADAPQQQQQQLAQNLFQGQMPRVEGAIIPQKRARNEDDSQSYMNEPPQNIKGGKRLKLNIAPQQTAAHRLSDLSAKGKGGRPRKIQPQPQGSAHGNVIQPEMFYGAPAAGSYILDGHPIAHFAANYDAGVRLNQSPYAPVHPTVNAPQTPSSTGEEVSGSTKVNGSAQPPQQPVKKSRKGVGGRPRKHPLPQEVAGFDSAQGEISGEAQTKQRKARRTATNNKLSAMVVENSDDGGLTGDESVADNDAAQGARRSGRPHKPTAAAIEAGIDSLSRPTSSSSHASVLTGSVGPSTSAAMAPPSASRHGHKLAADVSEGADGSAERPAKRIRKPTARAQGAPQFDGADDSGDDADTNTFTASASKARKRAPPPLLGRKVSVYEEYQALSSPTHNPLAKRGKRSAALKARQSFNVNDTSPEEDGEDTNEEEIEVFDGTEQHIKVEGVAGHLRNSEGEERRMSEYERYQALTSPSGGEVLGKRKRKPVVDMRQIMALERTDFE